MTADHSSLYRALSARDRRFDGLFFVGVTSTGIYCRPICPARTPRQANCRFFASAQEAEQAHFRPCLRCRPELAPGSAPVDDSQRIAQLILQRLEEGTIGNDAGLTSIARQFQLSSRQVRRIVRKELGVAPIQLLLTRRLLLAKQLLTETSLPVTDIAFASGFSSLRRFNDAFRTRYRLAPSRLRQQAGTGGDVARAPDTSTLQLVYRPPYDWHGVLHFLAARALRDVEWVTGSAYARTVALGEARGWIRITHAPDRHALLLEFTHSLTSVLPALLTRVRALFDLNARPDLISAHLGLDARLTPLLRKTPGLRVPGAFNGFELGVRAIIGQQVTVKSASTVGGRIVQAFGDRVVTPYAELSRLSPTPARLARAGVTELARLGMVSVRAESILALARAHETGELALDAGVSQPARVMQQLLQIPGIGPWTAHYIAMRALSWPDAFPKEDAVVRQRLGNLTASLAERRSQAWRPWRSYAVLLLWQEPPGRIASARRPTGRRPHLPARIRPALTAQ